MKRVGREEQTEYKFQPYIFSTQLSYFRMRTADEEKKEEERGRRGDHAKLVEARAKFQVLGNPLP